MGESFVHDISLWNWALSNQSSKLSTLKQQDCEWAVSDTPHSITAKMTQLCGSGFGYCGLTVMILNISHQIYWPTYGTVVGNSLLVSSVAKQTDDKPKVKLTDVIQVESSVAPSWQGFAKRHSESYLCFGEHYAFESLYLIHNSVSEHSCVQRRGCAIRSWPIRELQGSRFTSVSIQSVRNKCSSYSSMLNR